MAWHPDEFLGAQAVAFVAAVSRAFPLVRNLSHVFKLIISMLRCGQIFRKGQVILIMDLAHRFILLFMCLIFHVHRISSTIQAW